MPRYGALKLISAVLSIVGWIEILGGIAAGGVVAANFERVKEFVVGRDIPLSATQGAIVISAGTLVAVVLLGVLVLAVAQLLKLALDIENHTRKVAEQQVQPPPTQ